MADFITRAKALSSETIELLGEKIEVRGLGIGALVDLTRVKKGEEPKDNVTLTSELIAACCFTAEGKPLIPADKVGELKVFNPSIYNALNDAVTRVNGSIAGNSKATGKGGRHSA